MAQTRTSWLEQLRDRFFGAARQGQLVAKLRRSIRPCVELLETRLTPAIVSDGGTSTLGIILAANENLAIVSGGSSYTFTTNQSFSNSGVQYSSDFSGFGTSSLTVSASNQASYSSISITDSDVGTTVTFNDSGTNTYATSLNVALSNAAAGAITFNGSTAFSGSASLSASTTLNIVANSGATVSTQSGNLTLAANQGTNTAANFVGVNVNGAMIESATGSVLVEGTGGSDPGDHGSNFGVEVASGGAIETTGGSGTVTVVGTGGADDGNNDYGVEVAGTITSGGGNVSVTGQGGGAGQDGIFGEYHSLNIGVLVVGGGTITSGGSGTVTVQGTGNPTVGANDYGVEVAGTVTSGGGNVSITGQGGAPSQLTNYADRYNYGVYVQGGVVTAGGSGTVTVQGTGGAFGQSDAGVYLSSGEITSSGGNVSVTGQGGSGGYGLDDGVDLVSSSTISAGGSGTVTVQGTGGNDGYYTDYGVYLGLYCQVTSSGGNVTVTGQGGGSGAILYQQGDEIGVYLDVLSSVSAGNSGTVTVQGTGGPLGAGNDGVLMYYAQITSNGGNVSVTGQTHSSGGYGPAPVGIDLEAISTITAGGSGTVIVQGTAGSSYYGGGFGVLVGNQGTVTSGGGAVSVTGQGGGYVSSSNTDSSDDGIMIAAGGTITVGGSGTLTLSGTGGSGNAGSNFGVEVKGTVASNGGNIIITGVGGTGANNFGVDIADSSSSTTSINANGGTVSFTANTGTIQVDKKYQDGAFTRHGGTSIASNGFTATGLTMNVTFQAAPTPGEQFTILDDTATPAASNPISGSFGGLTPGSVISVTYQGVTYPFSVSYQGGDGNDLVLTNQLVAGASGPSDGVAYQPRIFTFTTTSTLADNAAGYTYQINWGDGTTKTVSATANNQSITETHAYTSTGSYTVSVTSIDQSGIISSTATQGITIKNVEMQNDPTSEGGITGLAVGGAPGTVLTPTGSGYGLKVTQNGILLGTFTPTNGTVAIYGDGGSDLVTIDGLTKSANTFTLSGSTATFTAGALGTQVFIIGLNGISSVTFQGGSKGNTFTNTAATIPSTLIGPSGGNNKYTFGGASMGALAAIQGAGTNNTVYGPNQANLWTLSGANAGTLDGPSNPFTGVQNLVGGTAGNTFSVQSGASGFGTLTGAGGGNNILDDTALSGPVSINLATGATSGDGISTIKGMNNLIGTGNGDTLTGANTTNTWKITGPNTGTVNAISFTNFANLIGGSGADTFTLVAGGDVGGTITGGGGIDTLVGPKSSYLTTWTLSGPNSGTIANSGPDLNNTTIPFSGITNLTGGSGSGGNTFGVGATASGFGSLTGPGTLDYSNDSALTAAITVNLAATTNAVPDFNRIQGITKIIGPNFANTLQGANATNAWKITGLNSGTLGAMSFANFANLTGGNVADTFTLVAGGAVTGTITGGSGNETLVGPKSSYLTTWTLNGAQSGTIANSGPDLDNTTISFSGIPNLTSGGGSGSNTFSVAAGASAFGTLTGPGTLDYSNDTAITAPITVNLSTTTNTVPDFNRIQGITNLIGPNFANTLQGANTTNAWKITGVNSGTINGMSFSNFANLTGGSGADTFTLVAGGAVTGTISGGSGNETLVGPKSSYLTTWTLNGAQTGTIANSGPDLDNTTISFSGIPNLTGGNSSNTFSVGAGASGFGTLGGPGTLDYSNDSALTSAITVNLAATTNAAPAFNRIQGLTNLIGPSFANTLQGANTTNAWKITGNNSGTLGAMAFTNFANLTGGTGADTFTLVAGGAVTGTISGGGGIETLVGPVSSSLTTWMLNGAESGTIANSGSDLNNTTISFSGIANLTGGNGSGGNEFSVAAGASGFGTLTGPGTLDYSNDSAITSAITVNLESTTNAGPDFKQIQGLTSLIGPSSTNTLMGGYGFNTWKITGNNSGTLNAMAFTNFAYLTGGYDFNTFLLMDGGDVTGQISGGAEFPQNDTLVGPISSSLNTWQLTGKRIGTITNSGSDLNNTTIVFSGIAMLIGGSGSGGNYFSVSGNTSAFVMVEGGGSGPNTLDVSSIRQSVSVNLADHDENGLNFGTYGIEYLKNFNQLIGNGGSVGGPDGHSSWEITGVNRGRFDGTTFTNFANLYGIGIYTLDAGAGLTGFISSNGGILIAPTSSTLTTWTLTGDLAGTLVNTTSLATTITFYGAWSLTGGNGNNLFEVGHYLIGGSIKGGTGAGTLNILDFHGATGYFIDVNLQTGYDSRLSGTLSNINMVIGSDGGVTDTLIGGSSPVILVGGGSFNEQLTAGSGRAILIAGSGSGGLIGGGSDDILIGGTVSYYNQSTDAINLAAFSAILTEWASNKSFTTRYNDLSSKWLGLGSVFDNGADDFLNRGTAGTDWFFLGAYDFNNHNSTDKVTYLM